MGIKVEHFRNIGYVAQCNVCNWDAEAGTKETPSEQDVRNAIRRHVRQSNHMVRLETTSSTHYENNQ